MERGYDIISIINRRDKGRREILDICVRGWDKKASDHHPSYMVH